MDAEVVAFTVPGKPVPKARPRVTKFGTYTPAKTANYHAAVQLAASQAMHDRPPLDGPQSLRMVVYVACPSSWSHKRKAEAYCGDIAATKKPDLDNVVKAIKDACNGIVWTDDSVVTRIDANKQYDEVPRVEVYVFPLPARRAP